MIKPDITKFNYQAIINFIKKFLSFFWKHLKVSSAIIFVVLPSIFIIFYIVVERTEFPIMEKSLSQNLVQTKNLDNRQKGAILVSSITSQLERELNSTLGWSANDIGPTKFLDNRNNRQKGVIYATKLLTQFFSTNIAKLGKGEEENPDLQAARDTYFVYQPSKYWFPSSERQYNLGIKKIFKYKKDLLAGKAVYNLRTDDVYKLLKFMTSENFLGEPLGRLNQHNEEQSFADLDDQIYYAQGVVLVVRDFVETLLALYPEYLTKGGQDNFKSALRDMRLIATFNPMVVLGGKHDSMLPDHRTKMNKYFFTLIERLNDIAESINR